ncbi:hypothetical protein EDD35_6612 [Amycolatopsis thermoflava]|uniref:Uncharacterized protein n=1 Tax=Amycolatopsis thermoflava TaxID=84480 RepID=A0A3N2H777_9PSEU|nr:hypothetical protein EDD35_6612 [Amycolatopsis thermoflava]
MVGSICRQWILARDPPAESAAKVALPCYVAIINSGMPAQPEGTDGTMTVTATTSPATVWVTVANTDRLRNGPTWAGRRLQGGRWSRVAMSRRCR